MRTTMLATLPLLTGCVVQPVLYVPVAYPGQAGPADTPVAAGALVGALIGAALTVPTAPAPAPGTWHAPAW